MKFNKIVLALSALSAIAAISLNAMERDPMKWSFSESTEDVQFRTLLRPEARKRPYVKKALDLATQKLERYNKALNEEQDPRIRDAYQKAIRDLQRKIRELQQPRAKL